MLRRILLVTLVVVCLVLVLTACAGAPPTPRLTNYGRVQLASVQVTWLPNVDAVTAACEASDIKAHAFAWACARVEISPDGRTSDCRIYAVRPEDFNDGERIMILGHEFWHCMGAEHARGPAPDPELLIVRIQ